MLPPDPRDCDWSGKARGDRSEEVSVPGALFTWGTGEWLTAAQRSVQGVSSRSKISFVQLYSPGDLLFLIATGSEDLLSPSGVSRDGGDGLVHVGVETALDVFARGLKKHWNYDLISSISFSSASTLLFRSSRSSDISESVFAFVNSPMSAWFRFG